MMIFRSRALHVRRLWHLIASHYMLQASKENLLAIKDKRSEMDVVVVK
jgi:hypothetical protein